MYICGSWAPVLLLALITSGVTLAHDAQIPASGGAPGVVAQDTGSESESSARVSSNAPSGGEESGNGSGVLQCLQRCTRICRYVRHPGLQAFCIALCVGACMLRGGGLGTPPAATP